MYNKAILIGNLGKDPDIRHLESGVTVAKFPVATNENYKDKSGEWKQITTWHDIVAWRGLAEKVERDLKKGSLVFVEGKITSRKYQDKEGIDRYITEVVAYAIKQLEKKTSGEGYFPEAAPENIQDSGTDQDEGNEETPKSGEDNDESGNDDDLPF